MTQTHFGCVEIIIIISTSSQPTPSFTTTLLQCHGLVSTTCNYLMLKITFSSTFLGIKINEEIHKAPQNMAEQITLTLDSGFP